VSVDVVVDGDRADVVLNRPDKLNALDFPMFDALAGACEEVHAAGVKVVVVRGAGRSFCSGIDLGLLGEGAGDPKATIARAQAGFRALAGLPMPTVAAVHGYALGAGLQIALACDVRIVTADATLGLLEVGYGIVPDLGGTQRLPPLVGPGVAKQMIWLAEKIDGSEAGRRGLAEIVVEPAGLDEAVGDLALRLAEIDPPAAAAAKRLVNLAGTVPLEDGMDAEAAEQAQLLGRLRL
jgi:enoyl-CoA hydratase/carnithine racemase